MRALASPAVVRQAFLAATLCEKVDTVSPIKRLETSSQRPKTAERKGGQLDVRPPYAAPARETGMCTCCPSNFSILRVNSRSKMYVSTAPVGPVELFFWHIHFELVGGAGGRLSTVIYWRGGSYCHSYETPVRGRRVSSDALVVEDRDPTYPRREASAPFRPSASVRTKTSARSAPPTPQRVWPRAWCLTTCRTQRRCISLALAKSPSWAERLVNGGKRGRGKRLTYLFRIVRSEVSVSLFQPA